MTQSITIKAGATFSVAFLALLPAGTWACDSDVRKTDDSLVQALSTTLTALGTPDASGNTHSGILAATSAQTTAWPIGTHQCDVRFTDASATPQILIFDKIMVVVEKAVTHD